MITIRLLQILRRCGSAHPLFNPKINPGINPKAAAIGNPTDPIAEGSFWKCDAVVLSAPIPLFVISVNVLFAAFSIGIHFTSNQPSYDKYVSVVPCCYQC